MILVNDIYNAPRCKSRSCLIYLIYRRKTDIFLTSYWRETFFVLYPCMGLFGLCHPKLGEIRPVFMVLFEIETQWTLGILSYISEPLLNF